MYLVLLTIAAVGLVALIVAARDRARTAAARTAGRAGQQLKRLSDLHLRYLAFGARDFYAVDLDKFGIPAAVLWAVVLTVVWLAVDIRKSDVPLYWLVFGYPACCVLWWFVGRYRERRRVSFREGQAAQRAIGLRESHNDERLDAARKLVADRVQDRTTLLRASGGEAMNEESLLRAAGTGEEPADQLLRPSAKQPPE